MKFFLTFIGTSFKYAQYVDLQRKASEYRVGTVQFTSGAHFLRNHKKGNFLFLAYSSGSHF